MAEQNSEAKPISTGHLCPAFSLRRSCTCATRPYSPSPLLLCVDNSISYGIVGEWPTLSFSSKMKRYPVFPDSFFAFEKLFFPRKLILRYFFIFIISRLSFRSLYSKNFEFQDESSSESWNTFLEQIYIITNSYRERVGIRIVFRVLLYHQVAEFFLRIFG